MALWVKDAMTKQLTLMCAILLNAIGHHAQDLSPTDKLALIQGNVTNFKGKIVAKETIIFANDADKKQFKALSDEKGNFAVLLPVNATYSLKYKNFTDDMDYSKMIVPIDEFATYKVKIKIDPPREIILNDVFFDTGKSSLKPASFKMLNELAEVLKIKSSMVVEIQGHTDNVGTEESNLKLSEARANEVRKYLIVKGIGANRIKSKGFGSQHPIADNDSDEGRAKNRRTELKVLSE